MPCIWLILTTCRRIIILKNKAIGGQMTKLFAFGYTTQNKILPMTINSDQTISFSRTHRLQWEEAQQKNVILYPEGMVELNESSAEILKLCDGTRNLAQIVSDLEQKFSTSGLTNDITAFLEVALQNGWINQN
jgi:pyrroloquinoline quinone biosynthesis protein D